MEVQPTGVHRAKADRLVVPARALPVCDNGLDLVLFFLTPVPANKMERFCTTRLTRLDFILELCWTFPIGVL